MIKTIISKILLVKAVLLFAVILPIKLNANCTEFSNSPLGEVVSDFTGQFSPSLAHNMPDSPGYLGSFIGVSSYQVFSTDTGSNSAVAHFQGTWWDVTQSGTVTFGWAYSTNDKSPENDPAGYLLDIPETFMSYPSQYNEAHGIYQLTSNYGKMMQRGTATVEVKAGGTFGFYNFTKDREGNPSKMVITNFSFLPSKADVEEEEDKICEWKIRVWAQNTGLGVSWYLKDADGTIIDSGTASTSTFNIISEEYKLEGPVTFYLNANDNEDPGAYRSVNYNVMRKGRKIFHGTVRNDEVLHEDIRCNSPVK